MRPIRSRTCGSPPPPIGEAAAILHELAHEAAGGRWVATGGGGYQWARVVPRAWTIAFAEMAEVELADELAGRLGRAGDGVVGRSGPGDAVRPRGRAPVTARTKLVCTLGPATNTPKFVRGLVAAGTSIFRINFSHGTPDDHARAVSLVRAAEAEGDRALAVLADLPGPKVRLGSMDPDPFRFAPGPAVRPAAGRLRRRGGRVDDVPGPRRATCVPATASCWPTARWSSP